MTNLSFPERDHPIPGMIDNPEWEVALTRQAELYLAERARRSDPEREPSGVGVSGFLIGAVCVVAIAVSMIAEVMP